MLCEIFNPSARLLKLHYSKGEIDLKQWSEESEETVTLLFFSERSPYIFVQCVFNSQIPQHSAEIIPLSQGQSCDLTLDWSNSH